MSMLLKQAGALTCLIFTLHLASTELFAGAPQAAGKPRPMIVVEATYPGAGSLVVADAVGTPIEEQVNGVEGSILLASRCNNDGTYLLAVTFKPGVDLDKARGLVQKRVALAEPALPEEVKRAGITV